MKPLFALLLAVLPAGGQAALEGRVSILEPRSAAGLRLEATRLELHPLPAGQSHATQPAADGAYRFHSLAPGVYQLDASHPAGLGQRTYLEIDTPGVYRCDVRIARRAVALAVTMVWLALTGLLIGAFASGILLYGLGRRRPLVRPRRRDRMAPLGSVTLGIMIWGMAFLLFRLLAPVMQPSLMEVMQPLSSIAAGVLTCCVVSTLIGLQPRPLAAASAFGAGWALTLSATTSDLSPTATRLAVGIGLIVWTTGGGWLLALGLRRRSYLVMAALVVAVADFWSVFFGPSGQVVQSTAPADQLRVSVMMLPWPQLGADLAPPMIGAGDFLILALLLAAAVRFELDRQRNFWALTSAFVVGAVITQVMAHLWSDLPGLPALPFLSAFFLLTNRRELSLEPADRKRIVFFLVGLAAALTVISLATRDQPPPTRAAPATERPDDWPWDTAALRLGAGGATVLERSEADGLVVEQIELATNEPVRGWLAFSPERRDHHGALVLDRLVAYEARAEAVRWAGGGLIALCLEWTGELDPYAPPAAHPPLVRHGRAALQSLDYLRSRDECSGEVTIVGDGWGGVLALALAARSENIGGVAVCNVGSIEGDEGAVGRELRLRDPVLIKDWLAAFEPLRNAARLRQPTLLCAGTNDRDYALEGIRWLADALPAGSVAELEPNADRVVTIAASPSALWGHPNRRPKALPPPAELVIEPLPTGDALRIKPAAGAQRPADEWSWLAAGPNGWAGWAWRRTNLGGQAVTVAADAPIRAVGVGRAGRLDTVLPLSPADLPRAGPVHETSTTLGTLWRLADPDAIRAGARLERVSNGWLLTSPRRSGEQLELVTNDVGRLRRLGPSARRLVVSVAAEPLPPLACAVVERYHQAGERRVALAPLSTHEFATRAPDGGPPIEWPAVDGLVVSIGTEDGRTELPFGGVTLTMLQTDEVMPAP